MKRKTITKRIPTTYIQQSLYFYLLNIYSTPPLASHHQQITHSPPLQLNTTFTYPNAKVDRKESSCEKEVYIVCHVVALFDKARNMHLITKIKGL